MERYYKTTEEGINTFVEIDTSKELLNTLNDLELVEENGIATVKSPLTDDDVEYLKGIFEEGGFGNIKKLYVNPIDLSPDARDELLTYTRTYFTEFPELYFIDDNGNDLNETVVELIKTAS